MNQNMNVQSNLSDQERMEDLLTQEKYMISSYSSFIPEASCPHLRQVLNDNLNGCVQDQFTVFEQMNQMGWYPVKNAAQPDIQAARQKFEQMKTQMV